jgi:ADP-heptose:LPS heptosyltransferase
MSGLRILIIQLERLGDLVQTTPLIQDLRRLDSSAEIDVLAWTEFAPIAEGMPGVHIRTMPSSRVKELNDDLEQAPTAEKDLGLPRYDRVINVSHEKFAAWLCGRYDVERREGGALSNGEWLYHGDWLTFFLALAAIRRENRYNIVDLYRGPAAAAPPPADARAHVACAGTLPFEWPEGRIAVIAPGASEDQRRFVTEPTVQLLRAIAAMGFRIVLVGAPSDRALAQTIAQNAEVPALNAAGRTGVQQLAEVIRRADLVVAADSAPAHIAAALGRPLVGLYGACLAPLTTAPWGAGHIILVHDSMKAFSPDLVMAAVRLRLGVDSGEDLQRKAAAAGVQAWRTAMLPSTADPLGGVTYEPLHADRFDEPETMRRLMRHVMAAVLMRKETIDTSALDRFAARLDSSLLPTLHDAEVKLNGLAGDVRRGLLQLRRRQFGGLQELVNRVTATVDGLKNAHGDHAAVAPVITFLDWRLRVMPAYDPERIFKEYERELHRAAKALKLAQPEGEKLVRG